MLKKLKRKYYVRMMTIDKGKIEIKEDRIICYVDNNYLHKNKSNTLGYEYNFRDSSFYKYNKTVLKQYDIDKPIYYIIENMNFDDKIRFRIKKNAHVIFRNCTFNYQVELWCNGEGEAIFENNHYYTKKDHKLLEEAFISGNIGNIKFINENFVNEGDSSELGFSYFGINVKADNVEIINSTLDARKFNAKINIKAKNVDILSSKIDCSDIFIDTEILDVYKGTITSEEGTLDIRANETSIDSSCLFCSLIALTSKKLDVPNTSIIASNGIIIENENDTKIEKIVSPLILHNGTLDSIKNEEAVNNLKLSITRNSLLNTLRNIRNMCENINLKKANYFKNNLDNQTTSKTLKLK